jgi:hypothetical protein
MAARFKKSMPQQRAVPVAPNWTKIAEPIPASPPRPQQPKMDMLDKGSAALWAVLSGLGGMLKQDVNLLKSDPIGSLKATADAWTVGQESRDRFKQGDYIGAINNSGLGGMAALPEMEKILSGKGKPSDVAWLAATYGTGPLGKAFKAGKTAVKTGTTKAYIDILNRLPKP